MRNKSITAAAAALFALAALSLTACQRETETSMTTVDNRAAVEELRAHQIAWGENYTKRDAEALIAGYAPDAVLFTPGNAPIRGREGYTRLMHDLAANHDFTLHWTVDSVRVSADGNTGYVAGSYVQTNPKPGGGSTEEVGYYLTTFEKVDGKWLATNEMNMPGKPE